VSFVHLHCHSPFSFLDGGSRIDLLIKRAAEFNMPALAITDHDNLCAAVQFHRAARAAGIKPIQGIEITLEGGHHLTLLAKGPEGYASLCRLVTRAHLSNPRGSPQAGIKDLDSLSDLIVLSGCRRSPIIAAILKRRYQEAWRETIRLKEIMGRDSFFIELQNPLLPGNRYINYRLLELAKQAGIEAVATNNVHYADKEGFKLHDVLCCVRTLTTVEDVNLERPFNAENFLKSPGEMEELFVFYPRAIINSLVIAERCEPALNPQAFHFPAWSLLPGEDSNTLLRQACWEGARNRYQKPGLQVVARLEHELKIIEEMGFADYFLVVRDLVEYARKQGIRYAGRGSAADSLVAYCLGITEVDSLERGLLFERFMNPERVGMPDIDIDFESRYRDKVIDYIYEKYGTDHVARVATYNTFRARSALRDIGKALGFAESELDPLCKRIPFYAAADQIRLLMDRLPELKNCGLHAPKYKLLLDCCEELAGFPRFLGMHLGGVVISDIPITQLTPLQSSGIGPAISQFDKDDIEYLGLIKLDLLPLRTLSVVREAAAYINQSEDFNYDQIPLNDQPTYEMINRGETIGVFQLESPAQRALQSRFNACEFEDIVASMALIRPGPIKGNMVEPYISRRQGREAITYLHPLLKPILDKTYGVVLFQEQVIEIAQAIAGFTLGEADQLRRVMTHSRSQKSMNEIGETFMKRAVQRGVEISVAREIFSCISGYAGYGFCEAHAAAFATTSFKTAYLVRHYPAQYFTAILNNQPMGFYPARIICNEARRRGIDILPPDINLSDALFTVERGAIRVGLNQVKGMSAAALESIIAARSSNPFASLEDFMLRTACSCDIIENLIKCGAFDTINLDRHYLLAVLLHGDAVRVTGDLATLTASPCNPPPCSAKYKAWEYEILGIEIGEHRMAAWRDEFKKRGICSSREVKSCKSGSMIKMGGFLLHPHRPPTRSGRITVFFSLEDEYGITDITMFEDIYMKYGYLVFGPQYGPLIVSGRLQRRGHGINIIAQKLERG
jgi:error-prone DNA polymerase